MPPPGPDWRYVPISRYTVLRVRPEEEEGILKAMAAHKARRHLWTVCLCVAAFLAVQLISITLVYLASR